MYANRGTPTHIAPRTERWLPHALIATAFVVVLPALAVWAIVPRGEAALLALSVPLGMLLSVLAASFAGSAYWQRRRGSGDLVFSELLLWGWLRRLRAERRLANAAEVLGLAEAGDHRGDDGLSDEERAQALRQLAAAREAEDAYLDGHSRRVARHSMMIARGMGLPRETVAKIRAAADVHDVGKLYVPAEILNKPDRLTEAEFEVVKRHPEDGAEMVSGLGDPELTAIVRHHHERLDGGGYPSGLRGEEIPLGARIVAVADTFDAITSRGRTARGTPQAQALAVLRARGGRRQLDAQARSPPSPAYYRGRRTVAWSAFATAAPQRLFAWLGGVTPGIGVGAAGAAALAIGVARPAAAGHHPSRGRASPGSSARGDGGSTGDRAQRPTRAGVTVASEQRETRRDSRGTPRKRPRRKRTQDRTPAAKHNGQSAKPPKVKAEQIQPPRKVKPDKVKPQKVKPEKIKPEQTKPEKTKAEKVKPVKPPKAQAPTVKPPKPPPAAKPPKTTPPVAVPAPAKPPKVKLPKP